MRIFLDAGHGGIAPITGRYTTEPAKQFRHAAGEFHRDGWFYEGVYNRAQAWTVRTVAEAAGIAVHMVADPWADTLLNVRTRKANDLYRKHGDGVYLSIHANAAPVPGLARGFEVFHYPGSPAGLRLAALIAKHFQADDLLSGLFRFRGVKQARFHVLRETIMPAVLVEHGFFDHPDDAAALMQQDVQEAFARVEVGAIQEYYGNQV